MASFGKPPLAWQRYVHDVALEIDADGQFVFNEVGLVVPRQQGKTTSTVGLMAWRCSAFDDQLVTYAAQTRDHARVKLEDDHIPLLGRSALADRFESIMTNGFERLKWDNRSVWGIQATTKKSGHGPTLDLGVADEYWAQVDARLRQAWVPATMTRFDPPGQFWWTSTVGDSTSIEMNESMTAGREQVESGSDSGVAYFEWSQWPQEDSASPATWVGCMPALDPDPGATRPAPGYTTTIKRIQAAYKGFKDKAEFARAYCCLRAGDVADHGPIDERIWGRCEDTHSYPTRPFALAIEVERDLSAGAIALVALRSDGLEHWEVIALGEGIAWIPDRAAQLVRRWAPCGVGLDAGGPAGALLNDLRKPPFTGRDQRLWAPAMTASEASTALLMVPTIREVGQATGSMISAVAELRGRWLGKEAQMPLHRAALTARTRPLGDAQAWQRRGSIAISPLTAVTLARWVRERRVPAYDPGNEQADPGVW
jgi:hypothetical protein